MKICWMKDAGTTDTFRLYVQAAAKRCCLMDKMEPGWNHYDLKHLLWVLDYYHDDFEDTFDVLLSNKDRQLNENLIKSGKYELP